MSDKSLLGRRRRANVVGGRLHRHDVKVSAEEHGALLVRAKSQGVSVPRLLVESALADAPRVSATERRYQFEALLVASRELAAVGNNLNQLVRVANQDRSIPVELRGDVAAVLRRVVDAMNRVEDRLDEAAKSL